MKSIQRLIRKIQRRFHPVHDNNDPFSILEAKGLKIAESSKRIMHSPWGIDGTFPWLIEIGEECLISTNVMIMAHDASTALSNGYTKIGRVNIGNHVFIGQDTTILCGVNIGDNVIIGAKSLVSKDIPSNSVYAGNPAKFICTFDEYRMKRQKELETLPVLDHDWIYWSKKATTEEKEEVKARLKETRICYFKSNFDPVQENLDIN